MAAWNALVGDLGVMVKDRYLGPNPFLVRDTDAGLVILGEGDGGKPKEKEDHSDSKQRIYFYVSKPSLIPKPLSTKASFSHPTS